MVVKKAARRKPPDSGSNRAFRRRFVSVRAAAEKDASHHGLHRELQVCQVGLLDFFLDDLLNGGIDEDMTGFHDALPSQQDRDLIAVFQPSQPAIYGGDIDMQEHRGAAHLVFGRVGEQEQRLQTSIPVSGGDPFGIGDLQKFSRTSTSCVVC